MKPFDVRLLRASRVVPWMLAAAAGSTVLNTTGIVLFAWAATAFVVALADGTSVDWTFLVGGLAGAALLRAFATWAGAAAMSRGAAKAKAALRARGMNALARGGSRVLQDTSRSDAVLVLGRGLDALDDYYGSYLPQLVTAAIASPILWFVVLSQDLQSAVTIAIVIPIIPIFMVLIGLATRSVQSAQWEALGALGRQFLDLVDGLSTLKIFRREHAQSKAIEAVGDEYRRRTMKVLRLSFLSGFTLELAATLSVALVAVLVGTRLVAGELTLAVGLFVLLLVPDLFGPLRQVGAGFHAAADGLTAANDLFALIDRAEAVHVEPAAQLPKARSGGADSIRLSDVSVSRDNRLVVRKLSATFDPGLITAIVGESGAGKSSVIASMLGYTPFDGSLRVGELAVSGAELRSIVAWMPQRAQLSAGTIATNVALGDDDPNLELVRDSLERAAASDLDPNRELGAAGAGLSGGQAQRVSLARALYRLERHGLGVLILDEPTSALDGETQQLLVDELRRQANRGVAVIVVSHRDRVVDAADAIVRVGAAT